MATHPTTRADRGIPAGTWPTGTAGLVSGGLVAGIIAGVVMGMVGMLRAAAEGAGFWFPLEQMAATFFGAEALLGGPGVVIVGMMIHLVMSAVFGLIFAFLVGGRTSAGAAFLWGLVYGVVIWAVMTYIALPVVNPVMYARVQLIELWWFVYHLIFGSMLLLTPALCRNFDQRARQA